MPQQNNNNYNEKKNRYDLLHVLFGHLIIQIQYPRRHTYIVLERMSFERLMGKFVNIVLRGMKHYKYVDESVYQMIREACLLSQ